MVKPEQSELWNIKVKLVRVIGLLVVGLLLFFLLPVGFFSVSLKRCERLSPKATSVMKGKFS